MVTQAFDVMGVVSRVAAAHDLSLTQLRVMAILRDRQPRMSELADYLGLDRSSLTGLVSRGEARGLLVRVPDPSDSRATRVALTDAGVAVARIGAEEIRAGVAALGE